MTDHHLIMRIIRDTENHAPRTAREGFELLETTANHRPGRWYLYSMVIGGQVCWPVLNEVKHEAIKDHAGWDLVRALGSPVGGY